MGYLIIELRKFKSENNEEIRNFNEEFTDEEKIKSFEVKFEMKNPNLQWATNWTLHFNISAVFHESLTVLWLPRPIFGAILDKFYEI